MLAFKIGVLVGWSSGSIAAQALVVSSEHPLLSHEALSRNASLSSVVAIM